MSTNANPPSSSNPSPGHSANATSASSSLWRARSYRLWFAADTTDVLAVSLRTFVIPLLALQLSGSEFIAGIIVALESAIGLLLLPFGGTLADRHDRRRMMILLGAIGTGLSAIAMALLALYMMNTPMFALCIALFAIMSGLLGTAIGLEYVGRLAVATARSRFHGGDGRGRGLFRSGIGRIVVRPAAQHSDSERWSEVSL